MTATRTMDKKVGNAEGLISFLVSRESEATAVHKEIVRVLKNAKPDDKRQIKEYFKKELRRLCNNVVRNLETRKRLKDKEKDVDAAIDLLKKIEGTVKEPQSRRILDSILKWAKKRGIQIRKDAEEWLGKAVNDDPKLASKEFGYLKKEYDNVASKGYERMNEDLKRGVSSGIDSLTKTDPSATVLVAFLASAKEKLSETGRRISTIGSTTFRGKVGKEVKVRLEECVAGIAVRKELKSLDAVVTKIEGGLQEIADRLDEMQRLTDEVIDDLSSLEESRDEVTQLVIKEVRGSDSSVSRLVEKLADISTEVESTKKKEVTNRDLGMWKLPKKYRKYLELMTDVGEIVQLGERIEGNKKKLAESKTLGDYGDIVGKSYVMKREIETLIGRLRERLVERLAAKRGRFRKVAKAEAEKIAEIEVELSRADSLGKIVGKYEEATDHIEKAEAKIKRTLKKEEQRKIFDILSAKSGDQINIEEIVKEVTEASKKPLKDLIEIRKKGLITEIRVVK